MILVTGAAGKTGLAVIQALAAREAAVRALVRRDEQVNRVLAAGAREALSGYMRELAAVRRAMQGVRAVYHIPPNVSPDELVIGEAVIAAARVEGVEHLVYHSVLHPQTKDMPHHWAKLRVEERVFKSGLPFTILQPTAYMQNILPQWEQVQEQGLYRIPYPVETRLSLVDLEDVARAATRVLSEPDHTGATYELVGTQPISQAEITEILGQEIGRPVQAQAVPLGEWEQDARQSGLGSHQIKTLLQMFRYYAQHGLVGNPRVLGWLLERQPTGFREFVKHSMLSK